jgi:hypothetical protein
VDHLIGEGLACVYETEKKAGAHIAKVLTCDTARPIAVNLAKALELLQLLAGSKQLLKRFVNWLDDRSALMDVKAAAKSYGR